MGALLMFLLAAVGLLGSSVVGFMAGEDDTAADGDAWALAWVHMTLQVLGIVASLAGYITPWYTTFDDIKREGSVGQRSSFTYVASLINCLLWFFYGCSPKGTVLIACLNLLGVGFQIFYLCVFWMYTEEDEDFHWGLVPLVSGLIAAVVIAMYFGSDIHGKIVFLSWCCAICKGLLAAAPLLTIRNLNSIPPLPVAVISLANAIFWAAYAWTRPQELEMDGFIFYPSAAAILSSIIQIVLQLHVVLKKVGEGNIPLA